MRTVLALAVLALPSLAAADPAAPAAEAGVLDLELADRGQEPLHVTLALAAERGCSAANTRRGAVEWDIEVCREPGDAALYSFKLGRTETGPAVRTSRVRVTSRLAPGRRVVLARLGADDGPLEVTVTRR